MEQLGSLLGTLLNFLTTMIGLAQDYPWATLPTFLAVFIYLNVTGHLVIFDWKNRTIRRTYAPQDALWAAAGILVAVFVSAFIGSVLSGIGWMVGGTLNLSKPFVQHPLIFLAFLTGFLACAGVHLLIRAGGRARQIDVFLGVALAFMALFATYVSTTVYAAIQSTTEKTSASKIAG